jgi:shikimate 5-dehydrogenase
MCVLQRLPPGLLLSVNFDTPINRIFVPGELAYIEMAVSQYVDACDITPPYKRVLDKPREGAKQIHCVNTLRKEDLTV